MQVCKTCGVIKPYSEYPLQRSPATWRGSGCPTYRKHCKACVAARAREWRQSNPGYQGTGKVLGIPKAERMLMSLIRMRVTDAKARAAGGTLTAEQAYALYQQQGGRCAISGLPLVLEKGSPWVPSLDQVVAGAGYHEHNVQWVAWAVNRAKGDLSNMDFLTMCQAIVEGATTIPSGSTPKRVEARSRLAPDDIV